MNISKIKVAKYNDTSPVRNLSINISLIKDIVWIRRFTMISFNTIHIQRITLFFFLKWSSSVMQVDYFLEHSGLSFLKQVT